MRSSLCLIVLTLVACAQPAPTPEPASILFVDDFSQNLSLWETFDEPGATAHIANHHLTLNLTQPASVAVSVAAINLADFDLSVNATFIEGELTNSYGVIFRYLDPGNFYRLDLTGDGLWGLSRRQNDQWISIAELKPSPAIHTGAATNAIRIVAVGDRFTFYANGVELGRLMDNKLSQGRIGLFASTFDQPAAQVNFDDLSIIKP